MAGQPTVVVQMRKEAIRVGVDINLAAVMKGVAITNHVWASPARTAVTVGVQQDDASIGSMTSLQPFIVCTSRLLEPSAGLRLRNVQYRLAQ